MNQTSQSRDVWQNLPWKKIQVQVFKLQKRIYRASLKGELKLVRKLQRLLMKSWYARLLAVRRVTQDNRGKRTAGIDGIKALAPQQRLTLAMSMQQSLPVLPSRRVWIDKPQRDDKRPLSIPTLRERARQALVKLLLEPQWEAKFEPNSYGFRPGRSAHDAIGAIFCAIKQTPKYVLDADIAQCFERINHEVLLEKIAAPPWLKRLLSGWLKAGVIDAGNWLPSASGTPQGGVLSPLLANIALHGLETHLCQQLPPRTIQCHGKRRLIASPRLIRYADDFVVLHEQLSVVYAAQAVISQWLSGIGLELHPDKTTVVHTLNGDELPTGFEFLGFWVRQYPVGKYHSGKTSQGKAKGFKTLIKPAPAKLKRHKRQLAQLIHNSWDAPQGQLIARLNPLIRGWSLYYQHGVSAAAFRALDHALTDKLLRWVRQRKPRKTNRYTHVARYWDIQPGQRWRFTTPTGFTLVWHTDTPIVRHVKIAATRSPFDGDWGYWIKRQASYPGLSRRVAGLLKQQQGKCSHCGLYFTSESLIEVHHQDGNHHHNQWENLAVLHRHCHDQVHGGETSTQVGIYDKDRFIEEPCEGKLSSTVLQPSGGSDSLA